MTEVYRYTVDYASGTTREFRVEGAGPTVLLLHGFGHSADTWGPTLRQLAQRNIAAIAPDLPGFGEAVPLAGEALLDQLDVFVAELVARHGQQQPVVLAGNSLGAALAVRAARTAGLPIASVLPIGIAGVAWTSLTGPALRPVAGLSRVLAPLPIRQAVLRRLTSAALRYLLYGDPRTADPQIIAGAAAAVTDLAAGHRLIAQGAAFKAELGGQREHGGVGVPMVIVHGGRDRLVPVSASRILHAANTGSRLVVLPGAGHCPQLDATGRIVELIRELAAATTDQESTRRYS